MPKGYLRGGKNSTYATEYLALIIQKRKSDYYNTVQLTAIDELKLTNCQVFYAHQRM